MNILIADDEKMVLEETVDTVKETLPDAEVFSADRALKAIEITKENHIDIAFLDIEMPNMNGLELSKKLKEINPDINIVFVTAYSEYAVEAFSLYASGYLLKPLTSDNINRALSNLRRPVAYEKNKLRVQCFGNFEVFYKSEPVNFQRAKAKEIFAYLVNLNGTSANTNELCAVLWEDEADIEKNKHYFRNLISDIKKAMKKCNASDVFVNNRNSFAVNTDKIDCDYYRFLNKDVDAVNSYRGEYMNQYSWAEFTIGKLNKAL